VIGLGTLVLDVMIRSDCLIRKVFRIGIWFEIKDEITFVDGAT
jgi:hypothetical protein